MAHLYTLLGIVLQRAAQRLTGAHGHNRGRSVPRLTGERPPVRGRGRSSCGLTASPRSSYPKTQKRAGVTLPPYQGRRPRILRAVWPHFPADSFLLFLLLDMYRSNMIVCVAAKSNSCIMPAACKLSSRSLYSSISFSRTNPIISTRMA